MSDASSRTSESESTRISALLSTARFGQFASVGVVGATVDFAVLLVLTGVAGTQREFAKLVAIESAILVMFAINERWTFATEGAVGLRPTGRRLVRSHAVRAAGTVMQLTVFVVLTRYVPLSIELFGLDLSLPVANAIAIGSGVVLNYTFESLLTWRVHEEE